jgi:hypothetical protein
MSTLGASARILLAELRRLAGDERLSARIAPMEWVAVAKKAGLSDKSRGEAITDLLKNKIISFQPETTQIIAFSPEGIEVADRLVREGPKLDGPIPQTLDRADLPKPNIQANFFGDNARLNVSSVDQSLNSAAGIQAANAQSASRHSAARRFLAPELQRTIDRVLYIHGRAAANFVSHSADTAIKPTDLKEDFIPHWPSLYPNAPQVRDLAEEDAAALSAYYDSLHALNDDVNDWWGREGQLPVNLFNVFLHRASRCLRLALICIEKFDLEALIPPRYESWGTISFRINQALKSEEQARAAHIARFEAKVGR